MGTVDSVNLTFHVTAQPNNIVVKDFGLAPVPRRNKANCV